MALAPQAARRWAFGGDWKADGGGRARGSKWARADGGPSGIRARLGALPAVGWLGPPRCVSLPGRRAQDRGSEGLLRPADLEFLAFAVIGFLLEQLAQRLDLDHKFVQGLDHLLPTVFASPSGIFLKLGNLVGDDRSQVLDLCSKFLRRHSHSIAVKKSLLAFPKERCALRRGLVTKTAGDRRSGSLQTDAPRPGATSTRGSA